jgi:hypothetical protein
MLGAINDQVTALVGRREALESVRKTVNVDEYRTQIVRRVRRIAAVAVPRTTCRRPAWALAYRLAGGQVTFGREVLVPSRPFPGRRHLPPGGVRIAASGSTRSCCAASPHRFLVVPCDTSSSPARILGVTHVPERNACAILHVNSFFALRAAHAAAGACAAECRDAFADPRPRTHSPGFVLCHSIPESCRARPRLPAWRPCGGRSRPRPGRREAGAVPSTAYVVVVSRSRRHIHSQVFALTPVK